MKKCLGALTLLLSLFLVSCQASLTTVLGDKVDALEEIEISHTSSIGFYFEKPAESKNEPDKTDRYKIGTTLNAETQFPIPDGKQGYRTLGWNYFEAENENADTPSNVHLVESVDTAGEMIVGSVSVTLRDLNFYAKDWVPRTDTPYMVRHLIQNTDLTGYSTLKTEKKQGTTDEPIDGADFVAVPEGFELSSTPPTTSTIFGNGSGLVEIKYDRKAITITINSDAGTFVGDPSATSKTINGHFGCTVAALPELKKESYEFQGFDDGSGTAENPAPVKTIKTFPLSDTTYTAVWRKMEASVGITVTFPNPTEADPTITPSTTTATAGSNVTFTVGGTHSSYQWYKDGVPIGGATSKSYTWKAESGVHIIMCVVDGKYSVAGEVTVTGTVN